MPHHSTAPTPRHRRGHAALRTGRAALPNHAYLITTTVRNRQPLFADFDAACAVSRCFHRPTLLATTTVLAWVLMPDHAHWLIQLGDDGDLNGAVNRLKSASARAANQALRRSGPVWTPAFHDRALRREHDLRAAARYVVVNPVRAGLVDSVARYPFWNAVWL